MRFLIVLPLLAVFAVGLPLSQDQENEKVANLVNELAASIYKAVSTQDSNVFFSPLSISTALAMLFYGARGNTAEEMRTALGYKDAELADSEVHAAFQSLLKTYSEDTVKDYLLYAANAVFTQKEFQVLPEYKEGLQTIYAAVAKNVDFKNPEALQDINDWVKSKTHNQISKFLDSVDPRTVMILLNAVYFKGTWKTEFHPKDTKDDVFFNKGLTSQQKRVPMMHLEERLPYGISEDRVKVLELPYKGEDISMVILLPDVEDGLESLEKKLTATTFTEYRKLAKKTRISVAIPKFKMDYEKNLNEQLRKLGVEDVFGGSADLSGISSAERVAVSKVVHKAVVEVNEQGSEASGVTGVEIVPVSIIFQKKSFVADHPFLFAIVDTRSGMILFQGRVNEL